MSAELPKPRFGEPCNHCGLCCRLALCPRLCAVVEEEARSGVAIMTVMNGIGVGCSMVDDDTDDAAVLDPFGGSGTTGTVSLELGRRAVLIELNPEYADMCERRCNITPGLGL